MLGLARRINAAKPLPNRQPDEPFRVGRFPGGPINDPRNAHTASAIVIAFRSILYRATAWNGITNAASFFPCSSAHGDIESLLSFTEDKPESIPGDASRCGALAARHHVSVRIAAVRDQITTGCHHEIGQ